MLFTCLCSLGADVIYDPSCLPRLVKVLSILLTWRKPISSKLNSNRDTDRKEDCFDVDSTESSKAKLESSNLKSLLEQMATGPVALIASVIRNIDTFNYFRKLCSQNNLDIRDITGSIWPFNLLPYMDSYRRSDVHLFLQSYSKWTSESFFFNELLDVKQVFWMIFNPDLAQHLKFVCLSDISLLFRITYSGNIVAQMLIDFCRLISKKRKIIKN